MQVKNGSYSLIDVFFLLCLIALFVTSRQCYSVKIFLNTLQLYSETFPVYPDSINRSARHRRARGHQIFFQNFSILYLVVKRCFLATSKRLQ